MAGIYEYNHAGAKIKAMKSKMLQKGDYEKLLQMTSVKEAALYLKNHICYKDALAEIDENDIHRGHLEILLYRSIMEDTDKISHYVAGYEKELFYFIYVDHEVEDIKKMLRSLHQKAPLDRRMLFLDKYSEIPYEKCMEAKTVDEFVECLKSTVYYKIIHPLQREDGSLPMFEIEMALDYYSYSEIIKHIYHFKMKESVDLALDIFGPMMDYDNILYIYRGKYYYHLPKEMLYRFTIPLFYHISKETVTAMIEAETIDELCDIVDRTYYGKIFNLRKKGVALSFKRFMRRHCIRLMSIHPFGLASILGYLYLKEIEIMDITAIIEGIRYSIGSGVDLANEIVYPIHRKEEKGGGN